MEDGDTEESLFLFVIIFTRTFLQFLQKYILHFLMDSQDKSIFLIYFPYAIIHFGQVGPVFLIIQSRKTLMN